MVSRPKRKQPQNTPAGRDKANEPAAEKNLITDVPPVEASGRTAAARAEDARPAAETTSGDASQWEQRTQRKSPFDSIGVYWKDGYRIIYQEKDNAFPRRSKVEIRFGDGSLKDKPLNFEKIKTRLTNAGMTFVAEDRAWGIDFARETRGDVSDHVKAVMREIVKLEEEVRGPRDGEKTTAQEVTR
jgi:hypothetical protein